MTNHRFRRYQRARLGLAISLGIGAACAPSCNSPDGVLIPSVGVGGGGGGHGAGGAGGAGGAPGPTAVWSRSITTNDQAVPTAMAVDIDGNPVVALRCSGQITFDASPLSTPGGYSDICVGKFDSDGTYKWSRFTGTPETDYVAGAGAITRDTVLFGYFESAVHFDPSLDLQSNGHGGMFLVRLDEMGKAAWGKAFGTDNLKSESPWAMSVDKDGNIVIAGSFEEAFDLDGTALVPMGYEDMFIAKFDAMGKKLWAKSFGAVDSYAEPRSVATDKDGRILIGGSLDGSIDFQGPTLHSAGSEDILLAAFSPDGAPLWSKAFGSIDWESAEKVAVDADGNIYLSGTQGLGCTDFGKLPAVCGKDSYDIFIAKFTGNGDYLWSHGFGDDKVQILGDAAVNAAGEVYLTGYFVGAFDAGNGVTLGPVDQETPSYPCHDMFLVKYDALGKCVFSARYGDRNDDRGLLLGFGPDDKLIAAGVYSKNLDFGDGPLTPSVPPLSNAFVTKLPL